MIAERGAVIDALSFHIESKKWHWTEAASDSQDRICPESPKAEVAEAQACRE